MTATNLLENAGNSTAGDPVPWFGGRGTVQVRGTFDGSTVAIQGAPPGTTHWSSFRRDASTGQLVFSVGGFDGFTAYSRWDVRGKVNGGTTNTDVTARLAGRGLLGST